MLCSLYYGKMEREHPALAGLVFQDRDLLMRLVDDFLLITPDASVAHGFVRVMSAGIHEYNCLVNVDKSLVNFETEERVPTPDSVWFPWCGMMIHTETLEVRADYSRLSLFRMSPVFVIHPFP